MSHFLKIYIDFDGTIARQDVGEKFVYTFGDADKVKSILDDWVEKKIDSGESWHLMLSTLNGLNEKSFSDMIAQVEIDPTFKEFIGYCHENKFEVRVLSDGFDFYINRILKQNGLTDLIVLSNKGSINSDGSVDITFPYGDEECHFCANCKRNHILTTSGDDEFTVYIGDGYSDRCPVEFCDFVFAKNDLLRHCEMNRISFFPYKDFIDIRRRLGMLLSGKRLKKHRQAELKRMEVYKSG
jgi:2,3-diketo-5-methylthio-1-phosphopentane phosphatase